MTFVSGSVGRVFTGESECVMLPRTGVTPGRHPIVYCHGAGLTGASAQAAGSGVTRMLDALCRDGWTIICPDLGPTLSSWGNDTALSRIGAARTFATSLGCASDKVVLVAGSMGTTDALNYARANLSQVSALAAAIPAVDVDDIRNNNRGSLRAGIDTAWGVTYPAALPTRANPATQAAGTFTGLPARFYISSGDTVAMPATATAIATAIGSTASVVTVSSAPHGDTPIQAIDLNDLLSFLDPRG